MSRRMSLPLINKSHDEQTTECVSCRKALRVCLKWEEKNHKLICVQFKKPKRRLRKTTTKLSTPSTSTVKSESSAPVLVPRSAWILQTLSSEIEAVIFYKSTNYLKNATLLLKYLQCTYIYCSQVMT